MDYSCRYDGTVYGAYGQGGLRYLSNMEYRLVRESLREQRTMANIAPNFVYPFPMLLPHYRSSLTSIIDHIQKSGGSLSHHHGVGRMMAPWMEAHFDPNHIMNPGGQLGLDLDPAQMRRP